MTMNRRSFLATTAAATAAMGTPMILRAQPKEYVLGASLPLTGPFATAGQLVAPAFAMAAKLLRHRGFGLCAAECAQQLPAGAGL